MIQHYKKPEIKFVINKDDFNKLMTILTFQEENIVTESWKEIATNIKEILLKYAIPHRDENGNVCILDISLYNKEASDLIVLLISILEFLKTEKDYTQFLKRK